MRALHLGFRKMASLRPFRLGAPLVIELTRPVARPGRAGRSDRPGIVKTWPLMVIRHVTTKTASGAAAFGTVSSIITDARGEA